MHGSKNRGLVLLCGLIALVSLTLFLIPAYVIRPFRHQSEGALSLAIRIKWIAPSLTLFLCAGVLALSAFLWRRLTKLGKAGVAVALVLTLASAIMVRQNYFEWMFNPIAAAGFVNAGDAHLGDKDMLMVVRIGAETRAYPILQMAYHHILNDTVATEPIVVTY